MKEPLEIRFWSKVLIGGPGCWEWQAAKYRDGYGEFLLCGKLTRAHRSAWMLAYGTLSEKDLVLHKCDNRACVRPDHLFLGTHADNIKDKVSKGRHKPGEQHPGAKLTNKEVREIRKQAATQTYTGVAKKYGVSVATISRIINKRNWLSV